MANDILDTTIAAALDMDAEEVQPKDELGPQKKRPQSDSTTARRILLVDAAVEQLFQ